MAYKDYLISCTSKYYKSAVDSLEDAIKITKDYFGSSFEVEGKEYKFFYKTKATRK